ncbi:putative glycerol kinase 5 isoform X3 [Corapipo altera]|uniref:putative glycerol kinase 5 isoform X3 n=1 Tax=Corapipo altera TaxID=415028 RepID=UPI000FD68752|nr:putative glycerol kinase 5 isoform X3 [Corapipo altera]
MWFCLLTLRRGVNSGRSTGGTAEKGSYGKLLQHLPQDHHFHFGLSSPALDRSLECLHSFIWFDSPVKDKTSHAFQRSKKLKISAEKMQKYRTQLLQRLVESLYPRPGWVELDPEVLWSQFVGVIKEAVQTAGLHMGQIAGLGISTQRGTFITWHKRTGKPFHNFISWQDIRSAELVRSWNKSLLLKVIHVIFTVLHFLTGNDRYLAPSFLTFSTQQTSMKLSWVFKNIPEAEEAAKKNNCCFGTIDTWLLYRLTKGSVYATDYSSASSTGIFEPFTKCWSPTLCNLLSLPKSIYPPVEDTSFNFGSTDSEIFGVPIPIMALVADQQSAMFGECCFHPGDVKLTMGTGGFWNVNTGERLFASHRSLYPLIGWKIGKEVVYLTEGTISDIGAAIKWAQDIDLFTNVDETAEMAQSVADSQGVCFIPGLQVSVDGTYLCASFMGLKPSTTRNHLVRAILESVAFRYWKHFMEYIMLNSTEYFF